MSIHFASLFCVDYDMDLAALWIDHYLALDFDSYTIWLNTQRDDSGKLFAVRDLFRDKGVEVCIASGKFLNGGLRVDTLGPFANSLDGNDHLVTADSDEFHNVQSRGFYEKYELTRGLTVDRYDKTLHDAIAGVPIKKQFPLQGDVESRVIASLPQGARAYWPRINKDKVCCALARLPVAFGGSHMLYPDGQGKQPEAECSPVIEAFHYCWRGSMLRRMAGKDYYDAAAIWYVWKFFGGVDGKEPPELLEKIADEEALQSRKGWVPCYG